MTVLFIISMLSFAFGSLFYFGSRTRIIPLLKTPQKVPLCFAVVGMVGMGVMTIYDGAFMALFIILLVMFIAGALSLYLVKPKSGM